MGGLIDWTVARGRMILALVLLSAFGGLAAYVSLPKEGSPNIDIPVLYISVPLPGVSAADAERLLVKPLEAKLRGVEGLKEMTGIAAEGYASVLLEFDFGWDKTGTIADVRALVDEAQAEMPADAEKALIKEVNLSAFPILVVSLSGDVPERTMQRLADNLQRELEALRPVLEVGIAGEREELVEVLVEPIRLESYDVTVPELLQVVAGNNSLVAAGAIEGEQGRFAVRVPGNFRTPEEIFQTPVRVSGDRVVTVADLATITRTFEDREGAARFNGERTVALQVKKRIGENIIDTVELVKERTREVVATWPPALQSAVTVGFALDQSQEVRDMVNQLEGSVITAVALVMLVVAVSLGLRSTLLVGLSIPLSFVLTFALLAAFGMSVNNMVMFGLILAVGILVDGGIVVTEYADRRISEGAEPSAAYVEAAKRMFWPVFSSTATIICAFLPMLFWPGVPGQFMSQLPITLIFVLSASLLVALVYVPVLGGMMGDGALRLGRALRGALGRRQRVPPVERAPGRTLFGRLVSLFVTNPIGPVVAIAGAVATMIAVAGVFAENNRGVEFFVTTEPQRAILYVRARGNLALEEKDALVRQVESRVMGVEGVASVFAFSGQGGLEQQGGDGPKDAIGQVQFELEPWGARPPGEGILEEMLARAQTVPGVIVELAKQEDGPEQGKPIQIRLQSADWDALVGGAGELAGRLAATPGLRDIEDTRPLPGIDWTVTVDREAAGRFGADIQTIGAIVQLVTRGAMIDVIRPDDAEDEIDIRVRFPRDQRALSTLQGLKMRTEMGLVPLGNFLTVEARPALAEITRFDGVRYLLVKADVEPGVNVNEKIAEIAADLQARPLPGVRPAFVGDQEEQAESQAFLMKAMIAALALMFAILLAQFNSLFQSVLVLTAVVMSITGVMVGMMVMDQPFSIIMTGTGVLALAGIVVSNNIVLIDTFRDFSRTMPPLEAIVRTAEQRIRPVLLTTITTMVGLAPMMFAVDINVGQVFPAFAALWEAGPLSAAAWSAFGATVLVKGAPAALWWVQLSTAVFFGLGVATVLTLLVTPAALAARVWWGVLLGRLAEFAPTAAGARLRADRRLLRRARRLPAEPLVWDVAEPVAPRPVAFPPRAYADAAE